MHYTFAIFFLSYALTKELIDDVKSISDYTDINMLLAIQILVPNADSKDFVDRPTKKPLSEVVKDFKLIQKDLGLKMFTEELLNIEHAATESRLSKSIIELAVDKKKKQTKNRELSKLQILNKFVEKNFHPVGHDIEYVEPSDFQDKPAFLDNIKDKELLKVAKALNETWKELSRRSVHIANGGSTTLLKLPFPFIIPGGRFREFYYWDTYWILEGLLVCDMIKTSENIVRNFIEIINTYGYIPNGTRKYYLNRSEPPYFSHMLLKLLDYEDGKLNPLVLGEGLDAALKEYEFFDKYKKMELKGSDGKMHFLNHFHVHTNFPRPESFSEDMITYQRQKEKTEEQIFSNIKSGAESGWDFSSRWLASETELNTIEAYHQIPVDLNAVLYRNELIISTLLSRRGDEEKALEFMKKSKDRIEAINAILWNPEEGVWMDYVTNTKSFVTHRFYFSNVTPMIYGIKPPKGKNTVYDILKKYSKEIFGYPGGIPASGDGVPTMQQWDFPNVWAPHQHMMVEFLLDLKEDKMAYHVARAFYNSAYAGYKSDKAFFEKYNCLETGSTGGGGEYAPQTGFGWTNGAVLSFILKFGDELMHDYSMEKGYASILQVLEDRVRKPDALKSLDLQFPLEEKMLLAGF